MGFADNYTKQKNNAVRGTTTPAPFRYSLPQLQQIPLTTRLESAIKTINSLTEQIKTLDTQIEAEKRALTRAINQGAPENEITLRRNNINLLQTSRAKLVTTRTSAINGREEIQKQINEKAEQSTSTGGGGGGGGGGAPDASVAGLTTGPDLARVNLSAARELYFKGNEQFIKETVDVQGFLPTKNKSGALTSGGGSFNSPTFASAFADYQVAQNLWKSGKATKGRIQTWMPPSNTLPSYLPQSSSTDLKDKQLDLDRRIFQFHYNPGSINMAYNGVPDIDVTMYTAGIERFNLWNQSKSTISFELLLNRMPDMKYIDPQAGNYRKSGVNYATEVYDRNPVNDELKEIHEKGTMYDVEFLLRVLLGYRLKSQLRGGKLTSDVGWITPRPVELHLGSSLRYLVNVVSLNLNHVIFNERMVPLFTTVSITGTRIPDFDSTTSAASGGKQ